MSCASDADCCLTTGRHIVDTSALLASSRVVLGAPSGSEGVRVADESTVHGRFGPTTVPVRVGPGPGVPLGRGAGALVSVQPPGSAAIFASVICSELHSGRATAAAQRGSRFCSRAQACSTGYAHTGLAQIGSGVAIEPHRRFIADASAIWRHFPGRRSRRPLKGFAPSGQDGARISCISAKYCRCSIAIPRLSRACFGIFKLVSHQSRCLWTQHPCRDAFGCKLSGWGCSSIRRWLLISVCVFRSHEFNAGPSTWLWTTVAEAVWPRCHEECQAIRQGISVKPSCSARRHFGLSGRHVLSFLWM